MTFAMSAEYAIPYSAQVRTQRIEFGGHPAGPGSRFEM